MSGRDDFFRFPHTPHLMWLGAGAPRGDKVLGPVEAAPFFQTEVLVEEKVDGAGVGFSVDSSGVLRAQNRGAFIEHGAHEQFGPLRQWMEAHRVALTEALEPDLMLFGEWCVAVHSIEYTALPDWFLAFDIYDRSTSLFWSTERRDALCLKLGIALVPKVALGRFDRKQLPGLIGASQLGAPHAEGIYVRIDEGKGSEARLGARAKIVRAEFQQAIGEHWSSRKIRRNRLAAQST
jgi:ATP-dependent RNA circularization protein (DNA/RNA ligase family)